MFEITGDKVQPVIKDMVYLQLHSVSLPICKLRIHTERCILALDKVYLIFNFHA